MHMMWPSLDSSVYSTTNTAAAVAAAACAANNNNGNNSVPSFGDYSPPLATAAANHFFNAASCGSYGVSSGSLKFDPSAENDIKCSMQQQQLANFVQSMSSLQQFQTSNNTVTGFNFGSNAYSLHNQSSSSNSSPSSIGPIKKKSNPVPQEAKTPAYYERRKKNNDSARRSREMRRLKEEENQRKNIKLQQENNRLLMENNHLTIELFNMRNAYNILLHQTQGLNSTSQQTLQSSYVQ